MAAGSKDCSWFVAPITIIWLFYSKPSISANIWFSVARLELLSPMPFLRDDESTLSISSMKMRHGCYLRASAKSCLTLLAPIPTNISSKSEPEQKMKLQPASPAIALASKVLPVPGSPRSITPLKSLAPLSWYSSGFWMTLMMFYISSLISSIPFTSSNLCSMDFAILISNLFIVFPMASPVMNETK